MEYSRHVDPGWRLIFLILKGLVGHPMVSYWKLSLPGLLGNGGQDGGRASQCQETCLGTRDFKCSVDCVSCLCL